MNTINHDFSADIASIGMKFCATGFSGDCRFVSVKISNGVIGGAEFTMLVPPIPQPAPERSSDSSEVWHRALTCVPASVATISFPVSERNSRGDHNLRGLETSSCRKS